MTLAPWTREFPLDAPLVESLIRSQCPELPLEPVSHLGEGWDADVWRSGDLVFRFCRRKAAIPTFEAETRVLPSLGPLLPLRIPQPNCVGRPTPEFPAPFWGHVMVPGRSADQWRLTREQRRTLAPQVARFLQALHSLGEAQGRSLGAPMDTFRGDMRRHLERGLACLHHLEGSLVAKRLTEVRARLEGPPDDAPSGNVTLLHGDLYARHLLLDPANTLTGVIDWGDVCLGDPAIDLSVVYTFLPSEARNDFWSVYGTVDEATRQRARYVGLVRYGLHLLAYALDMKDDPLIAEATRALDHALDP